MEAFPFTRVSDLPTGHKTVPAFTGLLNANETRQVYGDGVFGGAYQVDDAVMQELFDVCLADVLHLLKFD
jgi:creatinine amidohydrolase